MLKRIAVLLMILLFAGQALAGGIVCGIDALGDLNRSNEETCQMEKPDCCDDMACCMQGQSPTGSIVAMICCEVRCGESTGGAQFDFAPLNLAPAPPLIVVSPVSLDALSEIAASLAAVSLRSAENSSHYHDPPSLFLQNSAFLI